MSGIEYNFTGQPGHLLLTHILGLVLYISFVKTKPLISLVMKICVAYPSISLHNGIIKWKHVLRYCPFVRGIHQWPVHSPHKGQWCKPLMFSFIYIWTKFEQTLNTMIIWDAIMFIRMSLLCIAQGRTRKRVPYVEYVGPGLTWGRILRTCVISIWSNDIKCIYMFVFPLKNLAHKELMDTIKVRYHKNYFLSNAIITPSLFS